MKKRRPKRTYRPLGRVRIETGGQPVLCLSCEPTAGEAGDWRAVPINQTVYKPVLSVMADPDRGG